jgi:hypothetical protein
MIATLGGAIVLAGREGEWLMRRFWLQLLTLMAMNSMLLSSCPIQPPGQGTEHGGGGGGY